MVLRLDPQLPIVWRTPTSIQFGVTKPSVVLEGIDLATEKMIAALTAGVSRSGLGMIGRSAGATDAAIEALLELLTGVLLAPVESAPHTVVIYGVGRLADRLAALLSAAGARVLIATSVEAAESCSAELAIVVGHFVVDPGLHGLWLRRDVPHLPVVLGDSTVAVGPLIEPGTTACLYCLERHASEADPAWPAIASQLWGRRSPADTELAASEVGAIVARAALGVLRGRGGGQSDQLVVDTTTGSLSRRSFEIHPECGCVQLGLPNAAALAESD